MKVQRRYREKPSANQIGIASIHKEGRIHDFVKGWGTICKDGSILWDWWRPLTKRQYNHFQKHCKFDKWVFPVIKNMPDVKLEDIMKNQPMKGEN